jgi:hypothetical protein
MSLGRARYVAATCEGFTETGWAADLGGGGSTVQDVEERRDLRLPCILRTGFGESLVTIHSAVPAMQPASTATINSVLLGRRRRSRRPLANITRAKAGVTLNTSFRFDQISNTMTRTR